MNEPESDIEEKMVQATSHLEPAAKKKSIFDILQRRYPANEYALMQEVRDKAGFDASRSADFIAVNLWPSRGLAINGIELKSFRSDWLSELKNPNKAENIFKFCDYFWLLTSDDNVAKLEEIPSTWGWMSIKGEKIFVKKEAPKLEPIPVTRNFLCAMLKRACDKSNFVHVDNIQDRINEARESVMKKRSYELENSRDNFNRLRKILDDFKRASGIDLERNQWQKDYSKKIGEAVKFVENGGIESIQDDLKGLEVKAKKIVEEISKALSLPSPPKQ